MKKYTTQEQTIRLTQLGFREPIISDYSLAELIEILPKSYKVEPNTIYSLRIAYNYRFDAFSVWYVDVISIDVQVATGQPELIDAVYDALVELKEKKII